MLRAVIFDVDGTLVDSNDAHAKAWQDVFRKFGYEFSYKDLRHNVGKGADQYLRAFLSEQDASRHEEDIPEERLKIFESKYRAEVKPFPCVRELFDAIQQTGQKIALATSAKQDELESYLKMTGIEEFLDAKTTADDAARSKPHPDIFQAALERLQPLQPAEAIVVGDTPYDMEAARKAGIPPIAFLCGGFPEHELRDAGASEVLRDAAEMLQRWPELAARR